MKNIHFFKKFHRFFFSYVMSNVLQIKIIHNLPTLTNGLNGMQSQMY